MDGIGFPCTYPVEMIYPVDSTIVSVKSKLQHTLCIPQAFETFAVLGEGNLIISLLGGEEFDPHARVRVGNLNHSLNYMSIILLLVG